MTVNQVDDNISSANKLRLFYPPYCDKINLTGLKLYKHSIYSLVLRKIKLFFGIS